LIFDSLRGVAIQNSVQIDSFFLFSVTYVSRITAEFRSQEWNWLGVWL